MVRGICERYKKSALNAVNTAAQTLTVGSLLNFSVNNVLTGCSIEHIAGATSIVLRKAGLYSVDFSANMLGGVAGVVTLQLLNKGVPVPGAVATTNITAGEARNVNFNTLFVVDPSCCVVRNFANLQVQLLTTSATITNASISVVKEA